MSKVNKDAVGVIVGGIGCCSAIIAFVILILLFLW